jgi:hypothetical protein
VHLDRKVVAWSAAVDAAAIAAAHDAHQPIVFQLHGVKVSGDVRVSVFTLDELLEERDKRTKKGVSPRLPFDNASHGPWQGAAAAPVPAEPQGAATPAQDAAKRVIAGKVCACACCMCSRPSATPHTPTRRGLVQRGHTTHAQSCRADSTHSRSCRADASTVVDLAWCVRRACALAVAHMRAVCVVCLFCVAQETGCKFFALFHTGFVNRSGQLPVPLRMMDKAFKNKKNKYNADGVATLHFAFDEEAAGGASSGAPAPAQAETAQAETAHEEMADEGELETLHERV